VMTFCQKCVSNQELFPTKYGKLDVFFIIELLTILQASVSNYMFFYKHNVYKQNEPDF